jgi:hypothetical protein
MEQDMAIKTEERWRERLSRRPPPIHLFLLKKRHGDLKRFEDQEIMKTTQEMLQLPVRLVREALSDRQTGF